MEIEAGNKTTEFSILFKTFLVPPNLEDIRKVPEGTNMEPFSNVVTMHPTAMKDAIYDHWIQMLNLLFKAR